MCVTGDFIVGLISFILLCGLSLFLFVCVMGGVTDWFLERDADKRQELIRDIVGRVREDSVFIRMQRDIEDVSAQKREMESSINDFYIDRFRRLSDKKGELAFKDALTQEIEILKIRINDLEKKGTKHDQRSV